MNTNILVGTASWTDKTLIACGRFYPRGCTTAEQRLRFYAQQFPLVEVDSSYYALPASQTAQLWAERTPGDFVFNVKAFRLFTGHAAQPMVLPRDLQQALGGPPDRTVHDADLAPELRDELWRRFHEALAPLEAAGKLGAVHFQFAPWVQCDAAGRQLVEDCAARMGGRLVSVEFRHRSWFAGAQVERTLAWQRALGLVHTVVDAPQGFSNTVPCIWEVTHPRLTLLRLYGRNHATWNRKGLPSSAQRFDYQYSQEELAAMLPEIRGLAARAARVHVVFNTCHEDQGQVAARLLRGLLG